VLDVEAKDRNLLRGLARQFLEKTQHPSQHKLVQEWTLHNDLQPGSPKVLVYPDRDDAWLALNNRDHYTGNGGLGYTAQLPHSEQPGGSASLKDLW
jgi:hypothetical protein